MKSQFVKLDAISLNPTTNPARFLGGDVGGIVVKNNMDVDGMCDDLFRDGGIQRPVVVLKKSPLYTTELGVVQGNRRITAAKKLLLLGLAGIAAKYGDEVKAQTLLESFNKIPVIVYDSTGTVEGDMKLILKLGNDQDQAAYTQSGIYNAVRTMFRNGFGFTDICDVYGMQILPFTNTGRESAQKAREATDPKERKKIIETALRGRLDDEWLASIRLGGKVEKSFFTMLLRGDGLTTEQPEIALKRKDLAALKTAREQDGKDWNPERGGATFDVAWDKIKDEKAGNGGTSDGPKKPSNEVVKGMDGTVKSKAGRAVYMFLTGVKGVNLSDVLDEDRRAMDFEIAEATYFKYKEALKPAVRAVLDPLFSGKGGLEFETALASASK